MNEKVSVYLTIEQCNNLGKVLDSISGMENARALLPIYDAIKVAVTSVAKDESPVDHG